MLSLFLHFLLYRPSLPEQQAHLAEPSASHFFVAIVSVTFSFNPLALSLPDRYIKSTLTGTGVIICTATDAAKACQIGDEILSINDQSKHECFRYTIMFSPWPQYSRQPLGNEQYKGAMALEYRLPCEDRQHDTGSWVVQNIVDREFSIYGSWFRFLSKI